jgi:hypothetical protein
MPNSKHLTHGISNLGSLITKTKLGLSPAHEIQTIPASWPFVCWGLDMMGPFKPAPGNFKFIFELIDKFSKWIEYMTLVKASSEKVVEFLN